MYPTLAGDIFASQTDLTQFIFVGYRRRFWKGKIKNNHLSKPAPTQEY